MNVQTKTDGQRHEDEATAGSAASDPYRELFLRSSDPILTIDGDRFVDCNPAALGMLGYSEREKLLELHPSAISPPYQPDGSDSVEKANRFLAIASERGNHRFEWEHVRADGSTFPVEVLLTVVPTESGEKIHVIWRDLTEQKRLESQLRQAQKMDALGRLAGGIAHDFNNILVAVIGFSELLEGSLAVGDERRELANEIRKTGQRGARLVQQLLTFSRNDEVRPQELDLREVLDGLVSMLGRLVGGGCVVQLDMPDSAVWVRSDRTQVEQIVVNLITNARDAMSGRGSISVTLAVETPRSSRSNTTEGGERQRCARISVADEGVGMDSEMLSRAFEPFVTSKPEGEGTGLGLATVYGIAKRWGGDVEIDSELEVGTTVAISLPLISHSDDAGS